MRLRRLDQHPRAALILIGAASAVAHSALSLLVRSPLYTPDEWLYSELSRSILAGHPGHILGGHISIWSTISYVGPAITAPLGLIHDVNLAYHLSLVVGSLAFALAVFPTFALACRVGLTAGGALVAALLSQLIPAGAFTSTLLAEPYAYPAVLIAVLIAVDALTSPTIARIAGVIAASAALCLIGGMQFFVFPAAVAVAWVASPATWRAAGARLIVICAATPAAFEVIMLAGQGSVLTRIKASVLVEHYPLDGLAAWLGVNTLVLALATGWVVVPVAVVGIYRMLQTREPSITAFGWLVLSLTVGMLAEAAIWGANGNGVYERFTFYASPLLVIACLRELSGEPRGRVPYALLGYAAALAAILVPLTSYLLENAGGSPTMFGLTDDRPLRIVWPIVAAILAVASAAIGSRHGRLLVTLGATVLVLTTAVGFVALLHYQSHRAPNVHASRHATLLVDAVQSDSSKVAMRMAFWNPHIDRIVVLGRGGGAPTLPASFGGALTPDVGISLSDGSRVDGPLVVADTVAAWRAGRPLATGTARQLAKSPDLVIFGWAPGGLLLPVSDVLIAGDRHDARRLTLRLSALGHAIRLLVDCTARVSNPRSVAVPRTRSARLVLMVPAGGSQDCRLSLAPGGPVAFNEVTAVVRARLGRSST